MELAGRWARVTGAGRASAQQIIDQRYAHGEIDDDDYRRRRAELR
jgi:putative membrane protein